MDRLEELRAFVTMVDAGSQSAAARELNLTPAMVGRKLKSMEVRLGVQLLSRTTRHQSPTEAGLLFYERAATILGLLDAAERDISGGQGEPAGLVRLSAPMDFGQQILAGAVAAFCRANPKIRVEMVLNDRKLNLVEQGFDIAVRIGQIGDPGLAAQRLTGSEEVLCASPDYLHRRGHPSVPADLRHHDCLVYAYASTVRLWHFQGPEGEESVRIDGSLSANNGRALAAAAASGLGITLQPRFIVEDFLKDGRLVPVLAGFTPRPLDIYAVHPQRRNPAGKLQAFIAFLKHYFANPPEALGREG